MRLRSFTMFGVVAVFAAGCGSAGSGAAVGGGGSGGAAAGGGLAQPTSGGTVPSNPNQPPNSSSTPSNPNQPVKSSSTPGSGSIGDLCGSACALQGKYSCVVFGFTQGNCLTECQTALSASDPVALDCARASVHLLTCADAHGDLSCPSGGGDPKPKDAAKQDCANELAVAAQYCSGTQNFSGPCQSGTCNGCQNDCLKCMCQHPNDAQACAGDCAPSAGTP